jgi:hypothetical protein
VIGDPPPQEFAIDSIRWIREQRDAVREVLMYQIGGLKDSGTVRIDGHDDDVGAPQWAGRNQKMARGAQQENTQRSNDESACNNYHHADKCYRGLSDKHFVQSTGMSAWHQIQQSGTNDNQDVGCELPQIF